MTTLDDVFTPALVLDRGKVARNAARMAARTDELGVALRAHMKTPKSVHVARLLGVSRLTVSTLQELEYFLAHGYGDIFHAAPLDARKVARAAVSLRLSSRLSFLTDGLDAAQACGEAAAGEGVVLPFWVEIDVDGYRAGIDVDDPDFVRLVELLQRHPSLSFLGLMSYGGASYGCRDAEGMAAVAEAHRLALLDAQARLERAGFPCPRLSFGSTPAVMRAASLAGIDEVRCGIFAFQDLFQAGIGACGLEDMALSVLTTVVSRNARHNRLLVDAGGLALSKDRSTQGAAFDAGFGLVCDARTGRLLPNLYVAAVSQELGLITTRDGTPLDLDAYPVGSRLRVAPNHADMTAAAHEAYHVVDGDDAVLATWGRTNRW